MEIIAHFIQNLNTLNSLIYYITTNLEPLTINNDVNPKLIDLVNKPNVSDLLNEIAETKLMPDKWIKLLKIANGY